MTKEKLISVIVPIYNIELYLKQCLESLINQIYQNIEIILVDDGSTDQSGTICEEYAEIDKRIIVIHQKNQGLSGARNTGLRKASGDYLAFVDADDIVSKHYLSTLYWHLNQDDADIACCQYYSQKKSVVFPKKEPKLKGTLLSSKRMLAEWHGTNKYIETVVWNKLYKRDVFIHDGELILFAVGRNHEDILISHQLVANSKKIVLIDNKLYYYRKRKGSIVNGKISAKEIKDLMSAIIERLKFFESVSTDAYDKLLIGAEKYRALYNFRACFMGKALLEERKILVKMFCEDYQTAVNSKYCSFRDKILLRIFFIIFKFSR